jgi:hypothetical protein
MKLNCRNDNAAIREDYYILSIYIVRNEICIYIKILALVISIEVEVMVWTCASEVQSLTAFLSFFLSFCLFLTS